MRWGSVDYPSWLARSADPIRALWQLSLDGMFDKARVAQYVQHLLGYQYPHGGVPNTIGFMGDPSQRSWQDVVCPVRWNAYVFFLLATLADSLKLQSVTLQAANPFEFECQVSGGLVRETTSAIEMRVGERVLWCINKPSGIGKDVASNWLGDLSGPRLITNARSSS
jgi:hypothetical protein